MTEPYLFYAATDTGYIIKVLFEVLQNCLTETAFFTLTKEGMKLCSVDNNERLLINIQLNMENFLKYHCDAPRTIAINFKNFHKLIKNIKKKDAMTLFIKKDDPVKLGILIMPANQTKKAEREDESYLTIYEMKLLEIEIPTGYHQPTVIPSTEYQKMCKKIATVSGQTVKIDIQENNYISFLCDGNGIVMSKMSFGELDAKKKKYSGEFYSSMLTQLIKLPGLEKHMQISAPTKQLFPIRIKMKTGTLGEIEVYLKTKTLIDREKVEKDNSK